MKTLFIPAKYTGKADLSRIELNKLPKKIGLVATAQFIDKIDEIKNHLEKNGKDVFIGKNKQKAPGHILGCDAGAAIKVQENADAFLYVGSGEFHPLGVALSTKKDVFTFNPVSGVFSKLNKEEIEKYKKSKKAKYAGFLYANNIGIMVSVKPGQYSYKKALEIKKKLEEKGKKCFIFAFDTLSANELENFPFIDFWVNTACPRIADDPDKKNVIDMGEIGDILVSDKNKA